MAKPLTDRIEHVVVLMLENRSFDNVLGGLYPPLTKQGLYRGLHGNETNPIDVNQPNRGSVTVFQGPPTSSIWIMPYPDPGELYSDMVRQIFGSNSSLLPSGMTPPMSGFAWNYSGQPWSASGPGWPSVPPVPRNIMQYYSGDAMHVTTCLAKSYAVCDCWFASGPVQTLANRIFTHCGTPSRKANANQSRINNPDFFDILGLESTLFEPPVTDTTIFELLDQTYPDGIAPACSNWDNPTVRLNWKVYHHDAPLSVLCKYVYDHWCDTLFGGNVFPFYEYEVLSSETNFEYDIKNGLLPKYSFIEPRYSDFWGGIVNSNHPGGAGIDWEDINGESLPPPVNVMDGEALLGQIYSILMKYQEVFAKTLLIVTYDEHGGLFDHVPPPSAKSPFDPLVDNFGYDRYGVRVPTLLISPWIKPGTVYPQRTKPHTPVPNPAFDHTSILSTLISQFNLNGELTKRVNNAPELTELISDQWYEPPTCEPLPAPPPRLLQPREPRIATVPRHSRTLAGALGAIYRVMQSLPNRRPS